MNTYKIENSQLVITIIADTNLYGESSPIQEVLQQELHRIKYSKQGLHLSKISDNTYQICKDLNWLENNITRWLPRYIRHIDETVLLKFIIKPLKELAKTSEINIKITTRLATKGNKICYDMVYHKSIEEEQALLIDYQETYTLTTNLESIENFHKKFILDLVNKGADVYFNKEAEEEYKNYFYAKNSYQ